MSNRTNEHTLHICTLILAGIMLGVLTLTTVMIGCHIYLTKPNQELNPNIKESTNEADRTTL